MTEHHPSTDTAETAAAVEAARVALHSAEGWHLWAPDAHSRTAAAEAASQARLDAARAALADAEKAHAARVRIASIMHGLAATNYQAHATL